MSDYRWLKTFLFACLVFFIAGCGSAGLNSIQVTPASQSLSVGQTAQFNAVGTYGNASHASTQNVASAVTWRSSVPAVATVSSSEVATGVSAGTTTITASATLTVSGAGQGAVGGGKLLSLTILPSSITVGNLQDSGQFLAIGTFSSAPTVRDLTNSPTLKWISDLPRVFPVDTNSAGNMGATAGIVTAYGNGNAVITAETTGSDGSIQTASATFNCPLVLPNPPTTPGSCFPGSQAAALLAILTVYNEGLNTTNWLITASSATGTTNVIDCGPGASSGNSVCVTTYPFTNPAGNPTTVILKATGGNFGGWSYNCTPSDANGNLRQLGRVNT